MVPQNKKEQHHYNCGATPFTTILCLFYIFISLPFTYRRWPLALICEASPVNEVIWVSAVFLGVFASVWQGHDETGTLSIANVKKDVTA